VRELLAFHEEASSASDTKLLSLKKAIDAAQREVQAAKNVLRDANRGQNQTNTQASRDVSIIFTVPETAKATAEAEAEAGREAEAGVASLALRLTYNVSHAGWTPSYDLRVEQQQTTEQEGAGAAGKAAGEAAASSSKAKNKKQESELQLTYFGVVRQSTVSLRC
jgi:hypothetical protein